MNAQKAVAAGAILAAVAAGALQAAVPAIDPPRIEIKLRVYAGSRQGEATPPEVVTSSYLAERGIKIKKRPTASPIFGVPSELRSTVTANLPTGTESAAEPEQIKRVFNLQGLSLLTEADLIIGEGGQAPDRVRHYFRLDGSAFAVQLVYRDREISQRFVVAFDEIVAEKPQNILVTEMNLLGGHSAILGFEDRKGNPYFCSFTLTGPPEAIPFTPPPPPPAPRPEELKKQIEELERGAVKITDEAVPPKLIKYVQPVYPPEAKKDNLRGSAYLNVRTDVRGGVKQVLILECSDDVFREPAVQAVKQWKYEPYLQDGKPAEAVFSVALKFNLKIER